MSGQYLNCRMYSRRHKMASICLQISFATRRGVFHSFACNTLTSIGVSSLQCCHFCASDDRDSHLKCTRIRALSSVSASSSDISRLNSTRVQYMFCIQLVFSLSCVSNSSLCRCLVSRRKDLYLSTQQCFPTAAAGARPLTRLQERLLKKLGANAFPFYFEVPPHSFFMYSTLQ